MSSDTDHFESADDEPSPTSSNNNKQSASRDKSKKKLKQQAKSEPGPAPGPSSPARQDNVPAPVPVPGPGPAHQTKDDPSDDEWNDFDINDDAETENKPVKLEKQQDADGWQDDGFDDWDEAEESAVNKTPEMVPTVSKPTPSHTESDFKELADKLSALGEKQSENNNSGGWSGWGGWGANLLTSSVSQLTSHVSQGISTVANVLESGIGVPNPEELARIQKIEKEANVEKESAGDVDLSPSESNKKDDGFNAFKLDSLVSNMSKIVEKTTQSAVVVGGLDTLEEIGKRTMRVLQGEEDGKKRLSTLLREARDRADEPKPTENPEIVVKKFPVFETLFDDFQGLVHLEALEMLSKQSNILIQNLLRQTEGDALADLKETLSQVKDICELNDPDTEDENNKVENLDADGFKSKLTEATQDLGTTIGFDAIIDGWKDVCENCKESSNEEELTEEDIENIVSDAITNIAQSSAMSIQFLHRATTILATRERRSTADEADGLTQVTNLLISWINAVSVLYTQKLTRITKETADFNKTNEMVTNIFLEAEKGSSYVKDAFILTIPIIQIGAT